jgi:hypothetical protein
MQRGSLFSCGWSAASFFIYFFMILVAFGILVDATRLFTTLLNKQFTVT